MFSFLQRYYLVILMLKSSCTPVRPGDKRSLYVLKPSVGYKPAPLWSHWDFHGAFCCRAAAHCILSLSCSCSLCSLTSTNPSFPTLCFSFCLSPPFCFLLLGQICGTQTRSDLPVLCPPAAPPQTLQELQGAAQGRLVLLCNT